MHRARVLLLIVIALPGCFTGRQQTAQGIPAPYTTDSLIIWAHSDIQPRNLSERRHYETALRDIQKNIPHTLIAVVAGDMVESSVGTDYYDWFLRVRRRAGIPYWYEIAGNHEARSPGVYERYIGKPPYYSVTVGNILMLFMSDEDRDAPTYISPMTFEWWKKKVMENRDGIIITVTHASLKESGLLQAVFPSMIIKDSGRFADVLKKYRVDLWICGHSHQPYYLPGKNHVSRELNGTLFVDVASIRRDFPLDPIESRVLFFEKGSRHVLIRTRDHRKNIYIKELDIRHRLGRSFNWDGSPPRMEDSRTSFPKP